MAVELDGKVSKKQETSRQDTSVSLTSSRVPTSWNVLCNVKLDVIPLYDHSDGHI